MTVADLKWSIVFTGDNLRMDEILAFAKSAADAGADGFYATELGRDSFTPLAAIGAQISGVRLGTAVATFARPPMHTETAAMTMAELTNGNFILGLGTAPPAWNENWHGLSGYRPAPRLKEYIEAIRLMWTATPDHPISYEGRYVTVRDYARFIPAPCTAPPIYIAAVQERMLRLSGESCDGVIANTLNTQAYFRDTVRPNVEKGRQTAGRENLAFEYATLKICSVNSDATKARQLAKHTIAFYATLPYFDIVLDPAGFAEQKHRIRAASGSMDIEAMIGAVSDEMVDALVLAGTPDQVREQAETFRGLVDNLILYAPTFFVEPEQTRNAHTNMISAFRDA